MDASLNKRKCINPSRPKWFCVDVTVAPLSRSS